MEKILDFADLERMLRGKPVERNPPWCGIFFDLNERYASLVEIDGQEYVVQADRRKRKIPFCGKYSSWTVLRGQERLGPKVRESKRLYKLMKGMYDAQEEKVSLM